VLVQKINLILSKKRLYFITMVADKNDVPHYFFIFIKSNLNSIHILTSYISTLFHIFFSTTKLLVFEYTKQIKYYIMSNYKYIYIGV